MFCYLTAILGLLPIVALGLLALKRRSKADQGKTASKSTPFAPAGFFETIENFCGNKAPWFLVEQADILGTNIFKLRIPVWGGVYVVGDHQLKKEILLASTSDKPPTAATLNAIMGSPNIFTSPTNSYWKSVRKTTAHAFSKKEVGRMNEIAFEEAHNWMKKVELSSKKGYSFDPNKDMLQITFTVICKAAFEYIPSEIEFSQFCESLDICLREFVVKQQINPFRRGLKYFIPEVRKALCHCQRVQGLAKRILDAYDEKPANERSLNKTLIRLIAENDYLTPRDRIAEVVTFLIAGMDTTGCTLASTLVLLAKNPHVADKLRAELEACDPKEWSQCTYFKHVLQESYRIMPVSALGPTRKVDRDHVYDGGVIPKGSLVYLPIILQCYNEHVFPNPHTFFPERWSEDETTDPVKMSAMKDSVLPFSIGHRQCVGQPLAKAELQSLLPIFLSKYKFEVEKEGGLDFFLTLKYDNFKLTARRS